MGMAGVVGVLRNGGGLGTGESDASVMLLSVLHGSSSLAVVNFTAFTGNSVSHFIAL